ncbi:MULTISPECIES: hypothetical protein [unclassified Amycolatopsis]|uniref:hypothetical protein n=1 Tax=unclassified Amycolatopsis TaxID=2618356 RepID=UPI0028759CB8|nr:MULTISPECIES: hypothetical protein [unclassified Amycolatopsis]MDS0135301.1 hypothetical protein [Amycolatopsis sp. 505]MDS0141008.1 hypothetical protein [Amycolatopsis sp. CM201R]
MRLRGINYDTGFGGAVGDRSRRDFEPAVVRRELEIIATDLHCDTVRISGDDPSRLALAAHAAVDAGLRVWFSPFPMDLTPPQLTPYFAECARRAEEIRARDPETVLVLGCEMSLFCTGFVPGAVLMERLRNAMDPAAWAGFEHEWDFGAMLRDLVETAREHFGGQVTYAAGDWEEIDWTAFDFAAVNLYRSAANAEDFARHVRGHLSHGKPLVVTEFGCCTHRGAADAGGTGWTIVDFEAEPRVLNGDYVRDEAGQAAYFTELMDVFEAEGVHGAFWFTFAGYECPSDPDPRRDLDLASYGAVRVLNGQSGAAYPGLAWEPKEVFRAIAARFSR